MDMDDPSLESLDSLEAFESNLCAKFCTREIGKNASECHKYPIFS